MSSEFHRELSDAEAFAVLQRWRDRNAPLSVFYVGSDRAVTLVASVRIADLSEGMVALAGEQTTLHCWFEDATFGWGPMNAPELGDPAAGALVMLEPASLNGLVIEIGEDWMFISERYQFPGFNSSMSGLMG